MIVVQIVELANACKPALQHFRISLRGDDFHIIRCKRQGGPIHQIAPAPEIVGAGSARLRASGHHPLERVAVQIGEAREYNGMTGVRRLRGGIAFQDGNAAINNRQPHIAAPAVRQQRLFRKQICVCHSANLS